MMNGIRTATEDLNKAMEFILANAESYNVDPDRIALQGFSAGAVTSVHVAYALNAPVAAVIANSGGPVGFDITKTVSADSPPLLLFVGQHDLEGAIELAPVVRDIFAKADATFEFAWVPGAGHFYSASATSLGTDVLRLSIEDRIARFLAKTLGE
ncbi:MAG: alpha/beta hydrolase, partial [Geminicoccaceae bacterium]